MGYFLSIKSLFFERIIGELLEHKRRFVNSLVPKENKKGSIFSNIRPSTCFTAKMNLSQCSYLSFNRPFQQSIGITHCFGFSVKINGRVSGI